MKTVFIVDDDETNRMAAKTALENIYNSYALPSAQKMFKLLEKIRPDLILLDVDMPDMNGYEALSIMRADEKLKFIPVVFLTAKLDAESEIRGFEMGAIDFVHKPFSPPALIKRIEVHLLLESQRKTLLSQTEELNNYANNLHAMVLQKVENIIDLQSALLKTMAEMVECRDSNTGGHIERTQRYIRLLVDEIKKTELYINQTKAWDVDMLIQSCQLHDVGKISINDSILRKPGKLDEAEFNEMKKHAAYGEQLIKKIESLTKESDFLNCARIFAGSHHERWNGMGYPRGLSGEEIPLEGRIMAVADVYDALVSERSYKKPFNHKQAVEIIRKDSGTHFDPNIVDVFLNVADDFGALSSVNKDKNGEKG